MLSYKFKMQFQNNKQLYFSLLKSQAVSVLYFEHHVASDWNRFTYFRSCCCCLIFFYLFQFVGWFTTIKSFYRRFIYLAWYLFDTFEIHTWRINKISFVAIFLQNTQFYAIYIVNTHCSNYMQMQNVLIKICMSNRMRLIWLKQFARIEWATVSF